MKKTAGIPKAAPATAQDAYGRILDLADAVNALRVAGVSELHTLNLPPAAVEKLMEAHQALLAAHREIEKSIVG